jgi:putative oxidoreductase
MIRQVWAEMARSDDFALLIGRVAIALLFLPSGFGKLIGFFGFAASLAGKGLPVPAAWAAVAVLCEFGGSLCVLIGFKTRWAALAMAAFAVMAAILGHPYWTMSDPAAAAANHTQFFKDLALAGGLLFLHVAGGGRFSIDFWQRTSGAPR